MMIFFGTNVLLVLLGSAEGPAATREPSAALDDYLGGAMAIALLVFSVYAVPFFLDEEKDFQVSLFRLSAVGLAIATLIAFAFREDYQQHQLFRELQHDFIVERSDQMEGVKVLSRGDEGSKPIALYLIPAASLPSSVGAPYSPWEKGAEPEALQSLRHAVLAMPNAQMPDGSDPMQAEGFRRINFPGRQNIVTLLRGAQWALVRREEL